LPLLPATLNENGGDVSILKRRGTVAIIAADQRLCKLFRSFLILAERDSASLHQSTYVAERDAAQFYFHVLSNARFEEGIAVYLSSI